VRLVYDTFDPPPASNVLLLNLQFLAYSALRRPGLFWIVRDLYRALSKNGLLIGSFRGEEMQGILSADYHRRMPALFQARLRAKLLRTDAHIAYRKWVTTQYQKGLRELQIEPLPQVCGDAILLRYPILTKNKVGVL